MMTAPLLTLTVVAIYIVLLFVVARLSRRRGEAKTSKQPRWLITAAMVSASITGVTFISLPGSVVNDSFSYLQMSIGFVVAYIVIAYWLVPLYYRYNVTSLYEYLDNRFGVSSYATGAWFFLISKILSSALRLFVACLVLQQLLCEPLGIPLWVTVVVFMAFAWLYTHRGGLSSVIWGDLIKTLCMFSCVILSTVFVLRTLDISFVEAMQRGAEQGLTRIFFFDDINSDRHFLKLFFSSILLIVSTTGLDQDLMQRVLSSDSLRSAQRNMVISSIFQAMLLITLLVLGVVLYLYIGENGISGVKPDKAFAFVASCNGMPMIVRVLLVLGVVSASFSSVGGSLNALATSFTIDILHSRQRFDSRRSERVHSTMLLIMAILMLLLVLTFDRWSSGSSINLFFAMSSYTFGPLLGMFTFGVLSKRKICDRGVPVVAVLAPILCGVLDYNSERLFGGYQFGFEILLLNAVITMLGLLILSRPLKK